MMSCSANPFSDPSWIDSLVEIQVNGYLKLAIASRSDNDEEDSDNNSIMLLHSTENVLHLLNPVPQTRAVPDDNSQTTAVEQQSESSINNKESSSQSVENGNCTSKAVDPTMTNGVAKDDSDASFNHLIRVRDLFNSIQAALSDIQKMRQRLEEKGEKKEKRRGRPSRDQVRLRYLEHQQNRLQVHLSEQQQELERQQAEREQAEQEQQEGQQEQQEGQQEQQEGEQEQQEGEQEQQEGEQEQEDQRQQGVDMAINDDSNPSNEHRNPHLALVRWISTLNSVRALFPVLLPILNHERRNDVKLKICSYKLAVSSQGSRAVSKQCWLIGERVFDVTSQKSFKKLHQEMRGILECFVREPEVVDQVMAAKSIEDLDEFQSQFWTTEWLGWVRRGATIHPVSHPLQILAKESALPFDTLVEFARECDQQYVVEPLALMGQQGSTDVQDQYVTAIKALHAKLNDLLTSRFKGARLSLYGSCMSNLSLGQSSDVDLSLYIPLAETTQRDFDEGRIAPSKYESQMKTLVFQVCRKLESVWHTFRDMQPVARARVPVVSGYFMRAGNPHAPDGSIRFDICLMNDIAVANSSLIHQYSLVNKRARELMLIVKKWAQDHEINSAKNRFISSYAWMNMVIFYLQCIGMLPNLQCSELMQAVGLEPDPYWHSINKLKTAFLKWQDVEASGLWKPRLEEDIPVTALLYGFFRFYAYDFPWSTYCISIRTGGTNLAIKSVFRNAAIDFFCIEDPFETHDAYCPHDLGNPAHDSGQKKILDLLREGEEYLRNVLVATTVDKEVAGLWKKPTQPVSESSDQNKKNGEVQKKRQAVRSDRHSNQRRGQQTEQRIGQGADAQNERSTEATPANAMRNEKVDSANDRSPNRKNKTEHWIEQGADAQNQRSTEATPANGMPNEKGDLANERSPRRKNKPRRPPVSQGKTTQVQKLDDQRQSTIAEQPQTVAVTDNPALNGQPETPRKEATRNLDKSTQRSLEQQPIPTRRDSPRNVHSENQPKVVESENQQALLNGFSDSQSPSSSVLDNSNANERSPGIRRRRPGGRSSNHHGRSGDQNRRSGDQNGRSGDQNGRSGDQNRRSGDRNGVVGDQQLDAIPKSTRGPRAPRARGGEA